MSVTTTHKVGDKVTVDDPKFPGVWTVKSIGPKNTVVTPDAGGRGLRAPHWMIKAYDATAAAQVTVVPFVEKVFFDAGEIVRIPEGKFAGLYVVIADKGLDRVNVAKIGGDGGRYVRAGRRNLVKVDPSEVLK